MNRITKAGLGLLILGAGATAPIVPEEMELAYSYQYPADQYQENLEGLPGLSGKNPAPNFPDTNGDNLISVAVFQDRKGNDVYIQIDEARYAKMGEKGGIRDNPKRDEYISVFEALAPKRATAAIAFDATAGASALPGTSVTYAHTVAAGSNMVLVVSAYTVSDIVTSVTYNADALTEINSTTYLGATRYGATNFYLLAPDSGANNVVVTASASVNIRGDSMSYSGVQQSGQPGSVGSGANTTGTSFTCTQTTTVDDSWTVMASANNQGDPSAGADTTLRQVTGQGSGTADSNAPIATAGSNTLTTTFGSNANWATACFSLIPAEDVVITPFGDIIFFE